MRQTEKREKRRNKREKESPNAFLKNSVKGFLASVLIMLIMWIVCGGIAFSFDDPDSILDILGFFIAYFSVFFAGFIAVKLNGNRMAVCGLISGLLLVVTLMLVSVIFGDEYSSGYSFVIKIIMRLAMLFMSALGSFAGLHGIKRGRKRRTR